MSCLSAGARFRAALIEENPLQLVGTINAYTAMMAEQVGYKALYLSGAGVANYSCGMPDLGITNLHDVLTDVVRITSATQLPLLVDADTGWGAAFSIARTVQQLEKAGAAGLHIEDQIFAKRCGHRPGKAIVSKDEMVDRIKMAVDARKDDNFVIMARTDALQGEGITSAIDRMLAYIAAGADMVFPEAVTELKQYRQFTQAVKVPVLANITEFGVTPLFTLAELRSVGVQMALYPLSAARAMNAAALQVYQTLRQQGTQKNLLDKMQSREDLYRFLNYEHYEKKLDDLLTKEQSK